jgi:3-Oxoacyl-[acyl-carrier-protein (ACP)] synthase III
MSDIFLAGWGVVSPAGWGMPTFREVLARGEPMPLKELARPGWTQTLKIRPVPPPSPRPVFATHARLRRTSPIAQYVAAAGLEALGKDAANGGKEAAVASRLGIILCVMCGCVNYTRRFYDETLKDPSLASPMVFPETVYNAPSSHLAALLGTAAINYTLVGDPGTFLQGIALAADWLTAGRVEGCLVIGAEEMDWITANALRLFDAKLVMSEGAGALYLRRDLGDADSGVRLQAITEPWLFTREQPRELAAQRARAELSRNQPSTSRQPEPGEHTPACLLCDGLQGAPKMDRAETAAWSDWRGPRLSPKRVLGDGLMAAAAWQCAAAADAIARGDCASAEVSVVGSNQQAIAARFQRQG